jgi:glycosyltransferase involved in cell wall biosynthesis
VHTHLWQANLLGLSAAWLLGIKNRIYTRHHATIHYHEFPAGRKWDVLCNALATDIIAISQNIKDILIEWDRTDAKKVVLIPHGFDFNYFKSVADDRIQIVRDKYNLQNTFFPVIGVISRYVHWKGIQYIIPAFGKIREQYPMAKLILANANGDYEPTVRKLLRSLPVDSFVQIKFEEDLASLYQLFDVYVHVPIDAHVEAFGQTYVESMAAGIPSIFTLSGVAPEFVVHKSNAWVVDFKNSDQITEGIKVILSDADLVRRIKIETEHSIRRFSLEAHISALEKLYTNGR